MSVKSSRPALRWLVPIAATAVVIGGGAAIGTFAASADPSLPERSAAQLLVDLQTARLEGMSGTVVQRADLGLPEIPKIAGQAGLGLGSLLSGSNTLRVWYNGPEQARIALVSSMGEIDVIRNGQDAWYWDSGTNSGEHYRLPAGVGHEEAGDDRGKAGRPALPTPTDLPSTPQQAAEMALSMIEPSTEVSTGGSAKVAGRNAYELVLAPRDKQSLVGQVRLAIDATEHLPLRVEVFPVKADDPAFEVAFTQISFDRPDPARFQFNPPRGAKIEEKSGAQVEAEAEKQVDELSEQAMRMGPEDATVVGEGWTSVLAARISDEAGKQAGSDAQGAIDPQLLDVLGDLRKVSGNWGSGQVLSGSLFSVLLTDDGRVLAGLVSPERLTQVAGSAQAKLK